MRRLLRPLAATLAAVGLLAPTVRAAEPAPTLGQEVVAGAGDVPIAITWFRPAGADARHRVPVVLDSHGWGGSRRTTIDTTVGAFLAAGYGVVSIDQRGFGESGGEANVQDPDLEARDIMRVIDRVAGYDWVKLERPGDPVLGAIGGSYGGIYQTMTALAEQATRKGGTRLDAIAPEISWHDLNDSLAPADVPRTVWLTALYASAALALPPYIHRAFVEAFATGVMPASVKAEFASHGPRYFIDKGIRLDIPALIRQGASDNLFNLNQGIKNLHNMLTPKARAASRFVSFNGGHALPNVLPAGTLNNPLDAGVDACAVEDFTALTIAFFDRVLKGRGDGPAALSAPYNLTTADGGRCLHLASLPSPTTVPVGRVLTTTTVGLPQFVPLLTGKATVAGIPRLRGTLTALGVDTRFFLGLAIGTSPADARVIQNNVLPVRRTTPVTDDPLYTELPGVVADVAEGETLFLVLTPISDMFVLHGSRIPGAVVLEGATVELPLVKG